MSRFVWTALASLIAGAATSPVEASPACAPFDQLALDRLPTRWDTMNDSPSFVDTWRRWSDGADAGTRRLLRTAEARVRLQTADGLVPSPAAYEVVAWRERGRWSLRARKGRASGGYRWGAWRAVQVRQQTEHELEALLADVCLWSAPAFLASELPLASGKYAHSVDGPITFLEVGSGARRWGGVQDSWRLGPPATLRSVLMAAAFKEPRYVDRDPVATGFVTDQPDTVSD